MLKRGTCRARERDRIKNEGCLLKSMAQFWCGWDIL